MSSGLSWDPVVVTRDDVDHLIAALRRRAFTVLGPVRRDAAIHYDPIETSADLPAGWVDIQEAGHYRLERHDSPALFGFTVGPASWKRFLLPPAQTLWRIRRTDTGVSLEPGTEEPRYAFVGVRACEIAAIRIQDRVLMEGAHADRIYAERRARLFIVAVNCGRAGATCFCTSMGTGPRCTEGFDLALTEIVDGHGHRFLVEAGSEAGAGVLADVPSRPATDADRTAAAAVVAAAEAGMGRRMDTAGLAARLQAQPEHPRWAEVADRCLACGNCTLACPTCFCTTTVDEASLDGATASRTRHWDSCFSADFSYIHGGSVRPSTRARYRQWLTHKLSTWHDQFGTSGCVGCGRCITWCPVGIDLTEEVRALTAEPHGKEAPC